MRVLDGVLAGVLMGLIILFTGCAAPFSDLQSARVVDEGEFEITGYYSGIFMDEENLFGGAKMEDLQRHIGLQVEAGVGRSMAFRGRLERITFSNVDDDDDVSPYMVYALGPKFGNRTETMALYLPVGFATSDAMESASDLQFHPTLILGFPMGRDMELLGSGKLLIPIGDGDTLFAANIGLGIDVGSLVIRPETGFLMNPGEDGYFKQFSLGVSYRGGGR